MQIRLDFNNDFCKSSWDVSRRAREDSIRIIYDEARKGNVARFTWKPGDRANNGYRAELSDATLPPADTNIYYSYSLFIPQDFTIECGKFVVITQWHTPGSSQKPPVALRLRHSNRLDVTLNHKDTGSDFSAQGSQQIMLAQIDNFTRGVWIDFEYLMRWCGDENGAIEMKINGRTMAHYSGKTNYTNQITGPYFKYGIYPPVGNNAELSLLAGPYVMIIEPEHDFITSRGFNPDR